MRTILVLAIAVLLASTVRVKAEEELDFSNASRWKLVWVAGFDPTWDKQKDALLLVYHPVGQRRSAAVYAGMDYFSTHGRSGVFAIIYDPALVKVDGRVVSLQQSFYTNAAENGAVRWVKAEEIEITLDQSRDGAETPMFGTDSLFGQTFLKWVRSLGATERQAISSIPRWRYLATRSGGSDWYFPWMWEVTSSYWTR